MANYSYARAEYSDAAKSWQLVKDCVAGSRAIKEQGILYLPMPDPTNDSDENKARYTALLKRAMFLVRGSLAQCFAKLPRWICLIR